MNIYEIEAALRRYEEAVAEILRLWEGRAIAKPGRRSRGGESAQAPPSPQRIQSWGRHESTAGDSLTVVASSTTPVAVESVLLPARQSSP